MFNVMVIFISQQYYVFQQVKVLELIFNKSKLFKDVRTVT
jgi:hypothetical protein